jgi:type IV secretion system protein VirB5
MSKFNLSPVGVVVLLGFSSLAHSQILVTDTIQNAQTANHNVATVAQWGKEIAEMKQQYDMLKSQYDKMTVMEGLVSGTRNLGVTNTPGINGEIPADVNTIYSGSYGDTQSIMNSERVKGTNAQTQQQLNNRYFQASAAEKALALKTYEGAQARLDNINSLVSKINVSQDPKTIQDLQARIQAEQATVQNESTKLQMVSQLSKSEEKIVDEKRKQMNRDILNPSNTNMPGIK